MACEVLIGPLSGNAFTAQVLGEIGTTPSLSYTIPVTGTYLLEILDIGRQSFFSNYYSTLDLISLPPCVDDATSLCLGGWRFRVRADWESEDGRSGHASAVPLSGDTGYFWFFDPSNAEVIAKVLNGCSINDHYWFFAGGLTNVGVQIKVTDASSGAEKDYSNAVGTPLPPIQDTAAFSTCP
jgi:hypothetical protein